MTFRWMFCSITRRNGPSGLVSSPRSLQTIQIASTSSAALDRGQHLLGEELPDVGRAQQRHLRDVCEFICDETPDEAQVPLAHQHRCRRRGDRWSDNHDRSGLEPTRVRRIQSTLMMSAASGTNAPRAISNKTDRSGSSLLAHEACLRVGGVRRLPRAILVIVRFLRCAYEDRARIRNRHRAGAWKPRLRRQLAVERPHARQPHDSGGQVLGLRAQQQQFHAGSRLDQHGGDRRRRVVARGLPLQIRHQHDRACRAGAPRLPAEQPIERDGRSLCLRERIMLRQVPGTSLANTRHPLREQHRVVRVQASGRRGRRQRQPTAVWSMEPPGEPERVTQAIRDRGEIDGVATERTATAPPRDERAEHVVVGSVRQRESGPSDSGSNTGASPAWTGGTSCSSSGSTKTSV